MDLQICFAKTDARKEWEAEDASRYVLPLPSKSHNSDAGFDFYAPYDFTIFPLNSETINTEIRGLIPSGYCGLWWPRSGSSLINRLLCLAGVIDAGYTGLLRCGIYNGGADPWMVKEGQRFAQLVITTSPRTSVVELTESELDAFETHRGQNGGGSTGA